MQNKKAENPPHHLRACVNKTLQKYFADLNGETPRGIYKMVIDEVEKPLLVSVMKHADNNYSRAARMLGINRNTLRKKLEQHKLLE